MQLIHLSDLQVLPRQREDVAPAHIRALKESILSKGLLHALVLQDDQKTLVAGECRSRAIRELYEEGHTFSHNGESIPSGQVPYVRIGDLTLDQIAEAELEENLIRADLTWMEMASARLKIQKLKEIQQPGISRSEVGRQIAELSDKSAEAEAQILARAATVLDPEFKDNPLVKNSKSLKEAFTKVMDLKAAALRADLHKRGMIKTEHQLIRGDCRVEIPKLEAGTFDCILCDPPYGIKADEMKKTAGHHYDDSPAYALDICEFIIREGFKLLKPRGHLFMFCDIEHFIRLRDHGARQAYTSWRTPLIWRKGDEGQAPWGKEGFTRTYEICLFLTKGEKALKGGGPDVVDFKRPPRGDRSHAAEKPVALLTYLLTKSCDPGDQVLDPTCGSGPILEAASEAKVKAIAIEKDQDYFNFAASRLAKAQEGSQASARQSELLT